MFEQIIGYQAEKDELAIYCDTIRNNEYYKSLGIKVPKGIILYGEPGVGKTTFCNCIIEACGRPSYIIRKNAETGEFINKLKATFEEARKNAPSVILLDDVDKFGNGETFAQEYTSLQGIMDDYSQYDIFILATANEFRKLPSSLVRSGRFDRSIMIGNPNKLESAEITKYYMSGKNIDPSVNMDMISRMVSGYSCATLESIVNIASMIAAYERSPLIRKDHLIEAILTTVYDMPKKNDDRNPNERYVAAIHEAGHAVVCAMSLPDEFNLSTIRTGKGNRRFEWMFYESMFEYEPQKILNGAMVMLAGKAAVELKFGMVDPLSSFEIKQATNLIDKIITDYGAEGFGSISSWGEWETGCYDDDSKKKSGSIADDLYMCAKMILSQNWYLVEAVAQMLLNKETVLLDDVEALRYGSTNRLGANFNNLICHS